MQKIAQLGAHPAPTPCSVAFTSFLRALADYHEAERDLDGVDTLDLACDAWISGAERARSEVLTVLDIVVDRPPQSESDLHLLRVARLFLTALVTEDPVVYARIYGAMRDLPWLYRVDAHDQNAQHATQLLQAFRGQLLSLMRLAEFRPEFEVLDGACVDVFGTVEMANAAI